MLTWTTTLDIEADEFGIYDGRVIAQKLVADAMRLLLPYTEGRPGPVGVMMRALVLAAPKFWRGTWARVVSRAG